MRLAGEVTEEQAAQEREPEAEKAPCRSAAKCTRQHTGGITVSLCGRHRYRPGVYWHAEIKAGVEPRLYASVAHQGGGGCFYYENCRRVPILPIAYSLSVAYLLFAIRGVILMFDRLREDIATFKRRDPAARSSFEIFFLYPGLKAIRLHRLAHRLYRRRRFFLARWVSQYAARKTGIEIHPAATIGRRFFIDHGTGVVIGETAVIGDDVTIYQGVTLGGTGKDTGKRHPTIGNNVMIGAGAKVLGPFEVGDNSNIAAGAVVLNEIPPDSTAVGVPARVVRRNGLRVDELDQVHVPDPVAQELCRLEHQISLLRAAMQEHNNTEN